MKKFILPCIAIVGLYGQFAMAGTVPTSSTAPMISATDSATDVTLDAPDQIAKLQGEMKALQSEVQTLLNQSQVQNNESGANLDNIGVGG